MASLENSQSPLLISLSSDISYNEQNDNIPLSLATIVRMTDATSSSSSSMTVPSSIAKINEVNGLVKSTRTSKRTIPTRNVSRRLRHRKILHNRLSLLSDMMLFLGLLGIILMIIENEISFRSIDQEEINVRWFIKIIITITTVILIVLLFYYHRINLDLYAINNSLDHWRIGLTCRRIVLIVFEIFICAIHPLPRSIPFLWNDQHDHLEIPNPIPPSYIATDVAFGLPMFARIYLICRFVMFHSHLVYNASSQSLGYLNQVSIDFFFLIKTYLEQWPTRSLLIFCTFILFIGSWSLRACNYDSTPKHLSMLNSMWLFIVTFTTVGYGDLIPSTYCGRSIAAITGLIGVLSTALLISVIAQKLVLTRSEKYVHNFVLNIELAKERKVQAANIIKCAVKVWYLKRKYRPASIAYIKAQRRLVRAIHFSQQLKREQKKTIDHCVGLPELITLQRDIDMKIDNNKEKILSMTSTIESVEQKLSEINQTIIHLQNTLNILINKISK